MDFWKAILGLIRRKYIGLPILGVAVLVAGLAYFLTPAHYISSTTMVLTTPTSGGTLSQDPSKPTGLTNPLLNFDDGLKTTSVILIQAMNTPDVHKELGIEGSGTKLVVDDGTSNVSLIGAQGPFLYIEAESGSADAARAVVEAAQQRVRDELLNRQKALGAPPTTYITMIDVVAPSVPQADRAGQLQIAAAGFVLVLLGGIIGAYGAERLFAARRRKLPEPQPLPPSPTPRPLDAATERFAPVPTNGTPVNGAKVPDEVRSP